MSRWMKRSLLTVVAIFGLLLLSMLVVPWQLKKHGTAWIAENTARTLAIDKVYFNPFLLKLELTGVTLTEVDSAEPFVSWERLLVSVSLRSLIDQALILRRIELDHPYVKIDRLGAQIFNFSDVMPRGAEAAPASPAASSAVPLLHINRLTLVDGQIFFSDHSLSTVVTERIQDLTVTVDHFSTYPDQQATLELQLQTDRHLQVTASGQLGMVPLHADVTFAVTALELEPYAPYLDQILSTAVTGQLDVAGQITHGADATHLSNAALSVRDLRVPFGGEDGFTLDELQVRDAAVDVTGRQIHLGQLRLRGGDLRASRLADGSFSPQQLLRPATTVAGAEASAPLASAPAPAAPWQIEVGRFDLEQFNLGWRDETSAKRPLLAVKQIGIHAENLHYPAAQNSPFNLSANVGKQGKVRVDGSVIHSPLQLNATSHITALPLADFNDFIPVDLQLKVKDGQLAATTTLRLTQQRDALHGTFSGDVAVHRFNLQDGAGGELVHWQGLDVTGIEGEISPFALHVTEVALNDYQATIEISADGQVNLTSVRAAQTANEKEEHPGEQAGETKAQPIAATPHQPQPTSPPADIRIDAVTLQGGTVSFTDRHLPSTFATTMYDLGGRISGLAADTTMQADVDLRGQLENHSPLTITGKINPLSNELFADLTLRFKDIDLSALTPYSGTYLGYAIAKGKLHLDLNYSIDHQQIEADNKVLIDQFTFGDSMDSAEATTLPVALAVSLLKDRNDEIHLDIPISGNLNDPDFSLVGTIFTVLRNLLMKAATSPFALLSSLVPGGEDVSTLPFAAGRADIGAEQAHTLNGLANILSNRPSLTLEISGFADPANDPEAYRRRQLTESMQRVKWNELNDTQRQAGSVHDVQIGAEEYPELLKQLYKDAEFPRPRNAVGLLKSLPPAEMEKLLLANIVAADDEMAALAKARAMVVRDTLVAINAELKPRLFMMKTDIYAAPESGPASRVEFGISAK